MKNKNKKEAPYYSIQRKREVLNFSKSEFRELLQDIKDLGPSRFYPQKKPATTITRLFA